MHSHVVTLLHSPDRAWSEIRFDEERKDTHYLRDLLLMALVPALALFFGTWLTGWNLVGIERTTLAFASALRLSILFYLATLAGVAVMGALLRYITREQGIRPSLHQSVAFVTYLCTPFFIAGLFALYPSRWLAIVVLLVAGLHASYLMYRGLPVFLGLTQEKRYFYGACLWGAGLLVMVTLMVSMILYWTLGTQPEYQRSVNQDQAYPTQEERPREVPPQL